MSELQLPPRPDPPRRAADSARRWLEWFGLGRLVLSAACVTIVAGGALWLVRSGPPPVELTLPVATSAAPAATVVSAASPTPSTGPVLVHVAGAVRTPGVYELPAGARVDDAVRAAGGPLPVAELDGVNLAAFVTDGQRVYVPLEGEIDPAAVADPASAGEVPLDLNAATAEQLDSLPGVGPATAGAIVDDRERNGPFASVDDLVRVPGIGPAKLAALRELVTT